MTNIIAVKITWFTVLISDWDHSGCLVARVCGCGQCGLWKRFVFVCVCWCLYRVRHNPMYLCTYIDYPNPIQN